jgi:hypothetical protein
MRNGGGAAHRCDRHLRRVVPAALPTALPHAGRAGAAVASPGRHLRRLDVRFSEAEGCRRPSQPRARSATRPACRFPRDGAVVEVDGVAVRDATAGAAEHLAQIEGSRPLTTTHPTARGKPHCARPVAERGASDSGSDLDGFASRPSDARGGPRVQRAAESREQEAIDRHGAGQSRSSGQVGRHQ